MRKRVQPYAKTESKAWTAWRASPVLLETFRSYTRVAFVLCYNAGLYYRTKTIYSKMYCRSIVVQ